MGARIDGAGTERIEIEGVPELGGARHRDHPGPHRGRDPAGGRRHHRRRRHGHRRGAAPPDGVLAKLEESGAALERGPTTASGARDRRRPRPADIVTSPYPGLPHRHAGPVHGAAGPGRRAQSKITETIFENRFMHAAELARMGARIETEGSIAVVRGVPRLPGRPGDGHRPARLRLAGAGRPRGRGDDGGLARLPPRPRLRAARGRSCARSAPASSA